ncbi:hypothetical protein EI555_005722, partial [Monodon monoceros]
DGERKRQGVKLHREVGGRIPSQCLSFTKHLLPPRRGPNEKHLQPASPTPGVGLASVTAEQRSDALEATLRMHFPKSKEYSYHSKGGQDPDTHKENQRLRWPPGPELQPRPGWWRQQNRHKSLRVSGGVWSMREVSLQTQMTGYTCNSMLDKPGFLRNQGDFPVCCAPCVQRDDVLMKSLE